MGRTDLTMKGALVYLKKIAKKKEVVMGSIIDQISSRFGGQQSEEATNSKLLGGVMEMFSGGAGGIHGLVQSFQQKGLGGVISSWIGTGQNQPVSPEQVREGLGEEKLQNLAQQAGVSPEEASSRLSQHLPGFIDRLTPDGMIPEGGGVQKAFEALKQKFF